jgi:hypothetical protein
MTLEIIAGSIGAIFVGLTAFFSNKQIQKLILALKGTADMHASVTAIAADVRKLRTQINGLPCSAAREPTGRVHLAVCGPNGASQ